MRNDRPTGDTGRKPVSKDALLKGISAHSLPPNDVRRKKKKKMRNKQKQQLKRENWYWCFHCGTVAYQFDCRHVSLMECSGMSCSTKQCDRCRKLSKLVERAKRSGFHPPIEELKRLAYGL